MAVLVNHVAFNHVQSSNLTEIKMLTKITLGTESYLLNNPTKNSKRIPHQKILK